MTNDDERISIEMTRLDWNWLLSSALMGLSQVVVEDEKVEAIRTVQDALTREVDV